MKGAWRLAARDLARNGRRTAATGLAVALGFAALVVLGAYGTAAERFLRANAVYVQRGGHVMVFREGGLRKAALDPARYQLRPSEQRAIRAALEADPRVELTAPFLRGMGLAGNGCQSMPFVALGVDPALDRRIIEHPEVLATVPDLARPLRGRALGDYPGSEGPIGLAGGLARLLGKTRLHDDVGGAPVSPVRCDAPELAVQLARDANVQLAASTYDGALSAVDAEVVQVFRGTSRETEDALLLAPLDLLQRLYDTDGVTYVAAFLRDARDTHAVAADVARRLQAAGLRVSVHTFDDFAANPFYAGTMDFFRGMTLFILVLVLAVASLAMLNATTLNVVERMREIGTLRAIGYRRRDVRRQFLREAAILAAFALCAGLLLALAAIAAFNGAHVMIAAPGIPGEVWIFLSPTAGVIVGFAIVFVTALLAATALAVRRFARRRVADLLVTAAG